MDKIFSYITLMIAVAAMSLMNSCASARIPDLPTGKWERNGHIYEYTQAGWLYYDGERLDYDISVDGEVELTRKNGKQFTFNYKYNPNGTLDVEGNSWFPST